MPVERTMRSVLTVLVLGLIGCGSTAAPTCSTGGNCPCSAGGECRPALTCKVDNDWQVLNCSCASGNTFACTSTAKPSGPCEPTKYCNKGAPSCQAETTTCQRDCRCEYTTSPGQGVWLCQDNCGAAKDCPKARPANTACTLAPSVQCRYWSATDSEISCSCAGDGGSGAWSCSG